MSRDSLVSELAEEAASVQSEEPSEEKLSQLRALAERASSLDGEIEGLEERLKEAKKEKNEILTRKMVDLFDEAGTDHLGLPDAGVDFVVVPYYHARITDENREFVFGWLEENGYGDLIKSMIVAEFPREMWEEAKRAVRLLEYVYEGVTVNVKQDVPWKRYESFVKEAVEERKREPERFADAEPLPLEQLGATVGRITKIKKRKEK